ncbi:MAG TPA: helix-turn-helix transcriptional regulator [Propionibacteriaceae bacterium]
MDDVRMTLAVVSVLRAFLERPDEERFGYHLMKETGLASGRLYPILARLTKAGWLERIDPGDVPGPSGGPPRVSYRLTVEGLPAAQQELAIVHESLGLKPAAVVLGGLFPRPGWSS